MISSHRVASPSVLPAHACMDAVSESLVICILHAVDDDPSAWMHDAYAILFSYFVFIVVVLQRNILGPSIVICLGARD